MEVLEAIMKWIVAPVAAFVFMQYRTQQAHATDIAVLKAEAAANKQAHDREFKQLQDNFKAVFSKLDDIERALRK
jgi:soluble cytochrome b562